MEFIHTDHPIENEFPKLVRDSIPAIIQAKTGAPARTTVCADSAEYLSYLLRELVEEASEAKFSGERGNLEEELADVLEVVDAILVLKKIWLIE